MKVFLVMFTCGDYYCGCPGGGVSTVTGHLEGVYADRAKAEEAEARAEAVPAQDAWIEEVEVS